MKVLLQFKLCKKDKSFLFWSCVLCTYVKDEQGKFFEYINDKKIFKDPKIDDFEDYSLKIIYKQYEGSIPGPEKYIKLPREYFVAADETSKTGSPFKNAAANIITYYREGNFLDEFKKFCNLSSDYELNHLQYKIIECISKFFGIDILKNGSLPGALSIYERLKVFNVDGNYNRELDKRCITITSDENIENAFVEIEIQDKIQIESQYINKILWNQTKPYTNAFKLEFPEELEDFSNFRIAIIRQEKDKNILEKIYEETFHLVRGISFGFNVEDGGRLLSNRYANKKIERLSFYDTMNTYIGKKQGFYYIERKYNKFLYGENKLYLESKYFDNTSKGSSQFQVWMTSTLHGASEIIIADPYFDNAAWKDFLVCRETRPKLIIVTTNPNARNEKNKEEAKGLLQSIYADSPENKVYYASKMHDRYLFMTKYGNKTLYSLSNSWNGTVNNYSIYIQEVPFPAALQVLDEINDFIADNNLQKYEEGKNLQKKSMKARFCMRMKALKSYLEKCWKSCKKNSYKNKSIDKLVRKLLENQLENCKRKKYMIENKESFSSYKEKPVESIKQALIYDFEPCIYKELSLDECLANSLFEKFRENPHEVIRTIEKHEKQICKLLNENEKQGYEFHKKEGNEYCVSELIVRAFLINMVQKECLEKIIPEEIINLLKLTEDYCYIRLFFAIQVMRRHIPYGEAQINFNSFAEILESINLKSEELALVFAEYYKCLQNMRKQSNNVEQLKNDVIDHVVHNTKTEDIPYFTYYAFINAIELRKDILDKFSDKLKNMPEATHLFESTLLLASLQTNHKMQEKVAKIIKESGSIMSMLKLESKEEESDVDIYRFIYVLSYLGVTLSKYLKTDLKHLKSILHSLSVDSTIIFQLNKYPKNITISYYNILLVLHVVYHLKSGEEEVFQLIDWYLPALFSTVPNDHYGLALRVADVYCRLTDDSKKQELIKIVNYIPLKAFICATIAKQEPSYLKLYEKYISTCLIKENKENNVLSNLIYLAIALCIQSAKSDECYKTDLLCYIKKIREKIKGAVIECIFNIVNIGLEYAENANTESKKKFLDSMEKNGFYPFIASILSEEK
jgi:hypothetical protein